MNEAEKIKEELRYINEVLAYKGNDDIVTANIYKKLFSEHYIPTEYRHYKQYDVQELKEHKERLERDLQELQQDEWMSTAEISEDDE